MSVVTDTRWSPNYDAGRPSGGPTEIVIHHWGDDGQDHDQNVAYLCRPDGNSSAHYVASAGRVTQLVHDYDRAWHAGTSGNPRGIGIECRPECSPGDFETVARLIASIRDEWGPLPLSGHRDHMPTACPGRWYPRLAELSARADAIRNGAPTQEGDNEMTPDQATQLANVSYLLHNSLGPAIARLDRARVEDEARDTATMAAIKALAAAQGADPDQIAALVQGAVTEALKGLSVTLSLAPKEVAE